MIKSKRPKSAGNTRTTFVAMGMNQVLAVDTPVCNVICSWQARSSSGCTHCYCLRELIESSGSSIDLTSVSVLAAVHVVAYVSLLQAPALASLSSSKRRSPAGFNFDLDALIDVPEGTNSDHSAADQLKKQPDRQVLSTMDYKFTALLEPYHCCPHLTGTSYLPMFWSC